MWLRSLCISLVSGALSLPLSAQECDSAKPATAPMSRFKDNGNGTLSDANNRVWLRCGLGMSWNGSTCEGQTLTYNYYAAKNAIDEMNAKKVGGRSDWRLPKLDELKGIVESRCFQPAIDLTAFPFSPESGFWTSTDAPGVNPRAMIIHFLHGQSYIANKQQSWRVRPVAGN